MAYPLPYAFARTHELLLEEQPSGSTLWLHGANSPQAVSEVVRKHQPERFEVQEREALLQRISQPMPRVSPAPPRWSAKCRARPISRA